MKKNVAAILLLALVLLCFPSMDVRAGQWDSGRNIEATENRTLLQAGYTESGIYYEVFGRTGNISFFSTTVSVDREVVFYGRVIPESTMEWKEIIGGKTFTGTLKLHSYSYSVADEITTAYYRGNITTG